MVIVKPRGMKRNCTLSIFVPQKELDRSSQDRELNCFTKIKKKIPVAETSSSKQSFVLNL